MGYKELEIKIKTGYSEEELVSHISKIISNNDFSYTLLLKSLDARQKNNIHWNIKIGVKSNSINNSIEPEYSTLEIPYKKRNKKVIVVGCGPAGFFSAFVLQKAGFDVTIIERGAEVNIRAKAIHDFETKGIYNELGTYPFGEGGAGTFSDGKLTSRTKHISKEKSFILSSYINAGAPAEINYLVHPHIGSDNLKKVVKNLRKLFINIGGQIFFETKMIDFKIKNGKFNEIICNNRTLKADYLILATGHSAYDSYQMYLYKGLEFQTKNFAIGTRIEHNQNIINLSQWGYEKLPEVKAAEYRLSSKGDGKNQVYTFCMCPGGKIVPATAFPNTNIVNGMSNYLRNGLYANSACVVGIHPDLLANKKLNPLQALQTVEKLENLFFNFTKSFDAPSCTIKDFLNKKLSNNELPNSSYPFKLLPTELWKILPPQIINSLGLGLKDFTKKIKNFENGLMIGLESKTSSPIQVLRNDIALCKGFSNIFFVGEGSGFAGGIISSAADGVKAAIAIINNN